MSIAVAAAIGPDVVQTTGNLRDKMHISFTWVMRIADFDALVRVFWNAAVLIEFVFDQLC